MTVPEKVQQCIASLKSANASLESFALDTQDQSAKTVYRSAARETKALVDSLEARLREIESQPQYRQQQQQS